MGHLPEKSFEAPRAAALAIAAMAINAESAAYARNGLARRRTPRKSIRNCMKLLLLDGQKLTLAKRSDKRSPQASLAPPQSEREML